jgi:hypothetical protein
MAITRSPRIMIAQESPPRPAAAPSHLPEHAIYKPNRRGSGGVIRFGLNPEVLLMRPLLLHASSQALDPGHRRVLHFVYDGGDSMREHWFRRA